MWLFSQLLKILALREIFFSGVPFNVHLFFRDYVSYLTMFIVNAFYDPVLERRMIWITFLES